MVPLPFFLQEYGNTLLIRQHILQLCDCEGAIITLILWRKKTDQKHYFQLPNSTKLGHDFSDYLVCSILYIQIPLTLHFHQVDYCFSLVPHNMNIIRKSHKIVCVTETILYQGISHKKPQVAIYHLTHTLHACLKNSKILIVHC